MAESGRLTPIVRRYRGNLIVGTTNAFAQGVSHAAKELPTLVDGLGRAFSTRALPDGQLHEINLSLARSAQNAVVGGWRSRLPRGSIGYRPESRLTGKLGPALASPQMLQGTSSRVISFINMDHLDRAAAHWYRINYGAYGPNLAAGESADTFEINLNGRPFIVMRDDLPPSQSNYLPAQFFWTKGPVDMMIVKRGPAEQGRAKGARATHFIDLGLETLARSFPSTYQSFFNRWVQEEANRVRLARRDINVVTDVRLESIGYSIIVR